MASTGNEVLIQTRLGERSVDRDRIIHFPKGLIGFEKRYDWVLLQMKEGSPFMLMQSMDDPKLGLVVTDPFAFLSDYEVQVGEAEQRILRIAALQEVAIMVTVAIPPGKPDEASLNLTGPICVNSSSRIGLQVPQTDPRFPSHYSLKTRQMSGEQAAAEADE